MKRGEGGKVSELTHDQTTSKTKLNANISSTKLNANISMHSCGHQEVGYDGLC